MNTATNAEKDRPTNQNKNENWSYRGETGPEHWSDCNGKTQSPINIIDIDVIEDASLKPITIHYANNTKIHKVTNNGHSIQYDFEKGDYIMLHEEKYKLKQIHFHEPSEHTINGVRFPLEMHMVHVSIDSKIAVLAIMAQEGENSEPFTFLESYLPINKGEEKQIKANFDLNLNLPDNKEYYYYDGSLTTPPCSQNVSWFVFKTPITISLDQVKRLQKLMPLNNYRDVQPINGREIKQIAIKN